MYNCLDSVRQALQEQETYRSELAKTLRKLRHYKEFNLESSKYETKDHQESIYVSVYKTGEPEAVEFRTEEEKMDVIENVRRLRYCEIAAKYAEQNIRLLRKLAAKYRHPDPDGITKKLTQAYLPVPASCFEAGAPPDDFLTQKEINALVFDAAGPGASRADVRELAQRLAADPERLNELSGQIGERRLYNLTHPTFVNAPRHRTKDGTLVRSKSEMIESNFFTDNHIAYRYEEPVCVNGIWFTLDFVAQRPRTYEIIYLEHVGLIEDEKYRARESQKIGALTKAGFVIDRNLFFTFDLPGGQTDFGLLEKKLNYILYTR